MRMDAADFPLPEEPLVLYFFNPFPEEVLARVLSNLEESLAWAPRRVYVLEASAMEVRVFDPSGRHVGSFGRRGSGPGEFKQPIALTWGPADQLWVVDPGNARYSVFDTSGAFVRSYFRHNSSVQMPWPGIPAT